MKRSICLAGIIGMLALLITADVAQAQRRGGRGGRGGGGYIGIGPGGIYGGYSTGRGYWGGYGYGGYYGSPYYRSYYNGAYYYPADVQPQYATTEEAESRPNDALVHIRVPSADARVWIEGQETKQSGTERLFVSPPLERGKDYSYTVKATWNEGGREMSREKQVSFKLGQEVGVDFTQQGTDLAPLPKRVEPTRNEGGLDEESEARLEEQSTGKTHEGKVLSVGDGKLTMTNKDGNNKHTHNVATNATITRDGKDVKLEELKEGDVITVTTSADEKGKNWVMKIEARTK